MGNDHDEKKELGVPVENKDPEDGHRLRESAETDASILSTDTDLEAALPSHNPASSTPRVAQEPSLPAASIHSGGPNLSRATSARNPVETIPRSSRRGLLARLTLVPEVTVPYDYPNSTKWLVTFIVAIAAASAPMGSAILLPALKSVTHDFHTSPTTTNLSIALYMLAMGIFPLWWSSFSETLGRRTIYIVSFAMFTVFGIGSAVSQNIETLIVMRLLSGGASASVQAVGAGTIADIWEPKERGKAMGMFFIGPMCGPMFAPIFGGAMTQPLGWRSTMWFLVVYGVVLEAALIFCLPETLRKKRTSAAAAAAAGEAPKQTASHPIEARDGTSKEGAAHAASADAPLKRVTTRQSVQIKTRKWLMLLRRFFIDPLRIVLLLRFPPVFATVAYASSTYGVLYVLNISIESTFSAAPYNFSTIAVGLTYIPPSLGYLISSVLGGRWLDHIMKREAIKAGRYAPDGSGKLVFRPEDRMRENAWLGCVMFPAALVWYGWAVQHHVHWIVAMIANFFFGCGSMIIFAMSTTMLTEFMPGRASNGIAVNNLVRNVFSCIGAFVAAPLIAAVGNGRLFSALAVLCLGIGCAVIGAMKRHGNRWRDRMDEAMRDW